MKDGADSFIDQKPTVDVIVKVLPPEEVNTTVSDSEQINFQQALDEDIDDEMLNDCMEIKCVRILIL